MLAQIYLKIPANGFFWQFLATISDFFKKAKNFYF